MGKIILIEGTDCSGKETQSDLLIKKLREDNLNVEKISFPVYDSPTGKIIGSSYLGKPDMGESWFKEGATNVDPKVASLLYAADRRYHLKTIKEKLAKNDYLILDRYTFSNMAHQGGKIEDINRRKEMYNWIEELEFNLLDLPRPDIVFFLHMPYEQACILKKGRKEAPDEHEKSESHLKMAENTYVELSQIYNFKHIMCVEENRIKSIDEIHSEILNHLKNM